jgi:hypothetical protein
VEFDVTSLLGAVDGQNSFALGASPTSNGAVFNSRQATSNRPELVVTVSP